MLFPKGREGFRQSPKGLCHQNTPLLRVGCARSPIRVRVGTARVPEPQPRGPWVGAKRDAVGGRWTDVTVMSSASVASVVASAVGRQSTARAFRRGLSAVGRGGSGSRGSETVASCWYTLGGHPGISLERGIAGLHKTLRCETSLDRLGRVALPANAQGEHGLRDSVAVSGGLLGSPCN